MFSKILIPWYIHLELPTSGQFLDSIVDEVIVVNTLSEFLVKPHRLTWFLRFTLAPAPINFSTVPAYPP